MISMFYKEQMKIKNEGRCMLNKERRKEFEKSISNLDDFLKQLDIKVKIKKSNEFLNS